MWKTIGQPFNHGSEHKLTSDWDKNAKLLYAPMLQHAEHLSISGFVA